MHGRSLTDSRQQFIGMCVNIHLYLGLGRACIAVPCCLEIVETWNNICQCKNGTGRPMYECTQLAWKATLLQPLRRSYLSSQLITQLSSLVAIWLPSLSWEIECYRREQYHIYCTRNDAVVECIMEAISMRSRSLAPKPV